MTINKNTVIELLLGGMKLSDISRYLDQPMSILWKIKQDLEISITPIPVNARLLMKLVFNEDTGCLEYTGHKNENGYGLIYEGRMQEAHRVFYNLFINRIDEDVEIIHTCDNPACCKPSHLYVLGEDKQ